MVKDKVSRAKLEAVQELLGDKQDKGLEAMYDNYIKMSGDMGVTDAQLESVGVKNAVRHLRAQYAGAIKKGNRGFDNLITKLQNNGMGSLRTSVAATAHRNGDTRALSELLKDDFAANTLAGYNAGSLNDMHDATLQRYVDMAKNGALSGEQLSNFAKIVNEAFASGSINLKGEVGAAGAKVSGSRIWDWRHCSHRALTLARLSRLDRTLLSMLVYNLSNRYQVPLTGVSPEQLPSVSLKTPAAIWKAVRSLNQNERKSSVRLLLPRKDRV